MTGAGAGGVVGGLGAQLLMLPLEHCVFVIPEDGGISTQFYLGIGIALVSSLLFLVPYWIWVQKGRAMFQASETDTRNARFGAPRLPEFSLAEVVGIVLAIVALLTFFLSTWVTDGQRTFTGSALLVGVINPSDIVNIMTHYLFIPPLAIIIGFSLLMLSWYDPPTRPLMKRLVALTGLGGGLYFAAIFFNNQRSFDGIVDVVGFGFWVYLITLAFFVIQFAIPRREVENPLTSRGDLVPFAFLVPTLVVLIAFLYWPMYNVIRLSLKRSLLGLNARFVCTDNYISLVTGIESGRYQQSFIMTFGITLAIVVIGMGLSLFIANLANQKIRGAGVYRTLLIWPYALSPVVTGIIFTSMFNPQVGLVNFGLFELFGIRPQWFSDSSLAPWVVIAAGIWNNMGFNILFYIAGLQNVPGDLLEAASIDGANSIQRFFRVKFPLLSPYTFFLLITNVTYGFYGIFGAVDTLTQGGPRGKTEVLIYKLFTDAFEFQKTGSASAQSLILFLLVAGFTIIQFRYVDRRVTYGS